MTACTTRWSPPPASSSIPAAREQALIAAETYLCEQMPGMPMYTMTDDYLVKSDLKGVVKNKIGHIYFEYAYFE